MVIAAHPDDAEFGCGGAVAKWVASGASAFFLIATNGDKGNDSGEITPVELSIIRQTEQENAARTVGVQYLEFLPYEDGSLSANHDLRGRVVEMIRRWRPDTIVTHDPSTVFSRACGVNHSDHRNIGLATLDAVYPYARGANQYPEQIEAGLAPHCVPQILLWGSREPDYWEDITGFVEQKVNALLQHKSQYTSIESMRAAIERSLTTFGSPEARQFAEAFRRVSC